MKMKQRFSDILVIGSGIAGLSIAIDLSSEFKVTLVTKAQLQSGSTWYAQGGIAAATSKTDSAESHYTDTINAGGGLVRKSAARLLAENGPQAIERLSRLGIKFNQVSGRVSLGLEGGHSAPRIHHVADATGSAVEKALAEKAGLQSKNLQIFEHIFGVDLILDKNGACHGVVGDKDGSQMTFIAEHTVIASGGAGQIYKNTTNPETCTGDGIAMAFRAGALITDMEFVQFHPTAVYGQNGPKSLISESVRGEGAYLRDCSGKRFMLDEHKLAELAPRDVVTKAMFNAMTKCKKEFVFLDATHLSEQFLRARFPKIYQNLKDVGYDLATEYIKVAPSAHFFVGGIATDLRGRTSIPRLYACGEASCTGVHGANRLASNSLLEGVVFAEQIADEIRKTSNQINEEKSMEISQLNSGGNNRLLPVTKIKDIANKYLGVVRNKPGLEAALKSLYSERLFKMRMDNNENVNLATIGVLVAKGALDRNESRGVHYRTDYPEPNSLWKNKHVVFKQKAAEILTWEEMDRTIEQSWLEFGL
jgi:L-aspartate oxidase